MEITGKIIAALPERSGVSASTGNQWKTGAYVLETMEQYPKRICFEVFGTDKLQQFAIQIGEIVTVSFDVDAHEISGQMVQQYQSMEGRSTRLSGKRAGSCTGCHYPTLPAGSE